MLPAGSRIYKGFMKVYRCLQSAIPFFIPEQFAAVWVPLVIDGEFEDAAEVERQPAQGENQNQAEHRLGNLSSLNRCKNQEPSLTIIH